MNINIHTKYLKYKKKYLELKKKMNGGGFNDRDDNLENKEPVYELTNGYIINTFTVSTIKEVSLFIDLSENPGMKCIYKTDYSPIVFIPKIEGIGILRSDKDMLQTFLLSTQRREKQQLLLPLPNEMKRQIADFYVNPIAKKKYVPPFNISEDRTLVKNDYMHRLKYKLELPERISQTKMRTLIDSNYIDVAYAYDVNKPHIYYIFSDEEFRNNKASFINLFKIVKEGEPSTQSEIDAKAKVWFDKVKEDLLKLAFDFTWEEQQQLKQKQEYMLRNPMGAIGVPPPMYGDDDDNYD
jgi:hypothetical protein